MGQQLIVDLYAQPNRNTNTKGGDQDMGFHKYRYLTYLDISSKRIDSKLDSIIVCDGLILIEALPKIVKASSKFIEQLGKVAKPRFLIHAYPLDDAFIVKAMSSRAYHPMWEKIRRVLLEYKKKWLKLLT